MLQIVGRLSVYEVMPDRMSGRTPLTESQMAAALAHGEARLLDEGPNTILGYWWSALSRMAAATALGAFPAGSRIDDGVNGAKPTAPAALSGLGELAVSKMKIANPTTIGGLVSGSPSTTYAQMSPDGSSTYVLHTITNVTRTLLNNTTVRFTGVILPSELVGVVLTEEALFCTVSPSVDVMLARRAPISVPKGTAGIQLQHDVSFS